MVVLMDGEPAPPEYRRFKIRDIAGPNDFAMMHQVVTRRFLRGLKEREELAALDEAQREKEAKKAKFASFPDLVVIDGGKGQLSAARDAMRELGLEEIPTICLAERLEEIFQEDEPEPLLLDRSSPGPAPPPADPGRGAPLCPDLPPQAPGKEPVPLGARRHRGRGAQAEASPPAPLWFSKAAA